MPLSGKGMLITAMDADPAEEEDFSKWYDREHIVERVAIDLPRPRRPEVLRSRTFHELCDRFSEMLFRQALEE